MTLNDTQRRAVERTGPDVCVEAGPGSGKTRVLIERFRWLVDNGVSPDRILAFTFTEKAAAEIKTRLAKEFDSQSGLRALVERAWVSTVHGFCARLLRENAISAGIDPEFSVLDELQSFDMLRESAEESLEQIYTEEPQRMRELLEALDTASSAGQRRPDLALAILRIYDEIRITGASLDDLTRRLPQPNPEFGFRKLLLDIERLVTRLPFSTGAQRVRIERLRSWIASAKPFPARALDAIQVLGSFECDLKGVRAPYSEELKQIREVRVPALLSEYAALHYAPLRELLIESVSRIDRIYRAKKWSRSALDFSDLEEYAIRLLEENAEICERARHVFEHVLMDELQDTNPLQWRLVNLLRTPGCFFAVGDINQSIFGFRHATPEVFRVYRASLAERSLEIDTLRQNYRSAPEILEAVNAVLGNAGGIEPHGLTTESEATRVDAVELRVAAEDTTDEAVELEAQWVAHRMIELSEHYSFGKMAVLLRTLNSLPPLQRALEQARIPFVVTGARSFFESREVLDLTQWLRVLDNPLDEISLAGVLRSPLAGVGDETILRLKLRGGLYQGILQCRSEELDEREFERLAAFRARLRRALRERDHLSPDRLLLRAMDEAGYDTALTAAARASIARFLDLLRSHTRTRPVSFASLLEQIERHRESEAEIEVACDEAVNAVRIMSMHRAKGLEFAVVFLPFLHRAAASAAAPICFSREEGLAARWRSPAGGRPIAEPDHTAISERRRAEEAAEESRLLYVAMTRAENRLVMSYSEGKRSASGWAALIAGNLPSPGRPVPAVAEEQLTHLLPCDPQPEIVTPPLVRAQHDSVVTVTSLSEFASCPRRYYLGRYLGWQSSRAVFGHDRDPDEVDYPEASELGRQVHQALAGAAPEHMHPAAVELVRAFLSSEMGRRVSRASRIEREYEFVTSFGDVVVRGQIDLWFEEGGELILVDYKTDQFDPRSAAERVQPYALQLRIYAIALERIAGRLPDRAVLEFLRSDRSVDVSLTRESLEEAELVVRQLSEAQQKMDFPMNEGNWCGRCEFFRTSCPAGRVTIASALPPSSSAARP